MAAKKPLNLKIDEDLKKKYEYVLWHERNPNITADIVEHIEKRIAVFEKANGTITDKNMKEARII